MRNAAYDSKKEWTKEFLKSDMPYPSEYVIRILKGSFPNLNLDKNDFVGKKFLDMGCGEGRNLALAKSVGFDICGVEITDEIVGAINSNLSKMGIDEYDIRTGTNDNIPFEDSEIDYMLSWNACYYMGDKTDFQEYVKEFGRVMKKDGYLILSIPKETCFIYKGSEELKKGYQIIKNDPFNVRNGEVLRMFSSYEEIEESFGEYFKDFTFASIHDDCFGYDYHWYLAVCRKK